MNNIKIVIATHKNDFWFCRICVASIRYYYPDIEIFILKDEINGQFDTDELEEYWQVKPFPLSQKMFGWSAAKIFFMLEANKGEKYLMLDSDIVFIGPCLERLAKKVADNDILVSANYMAESVVATEEWIIKSYFELNKVKDYDTAYQYPGYLFNAGQLFFTGGCLKEDFLLGLFDTQKYPYYINTTVFPIVDQSILNYIFAKRQMKGELTVATDAFMYWSEVASLSEVSFEAIVEKRIDFGIIHWAGALRTPLLKPMTRNDVLIFFENYYYSKVPFGKLKQLGRKITALYRDGVSRLFQKNRSK